MPCEPLAHLRMLMGCVVVDDGWIASAWHLRFDGIEEADELLMPVVLHVAADDGAVEDIESGEQRGRAVTFVVVGHRSGAARLIGSPGWVWSSAWIWLTWGFAGQDVQIKITS